MVIHALAGDCFLIILGRFPSAYQQEVMIGALLKQRNNLPDTIYLFIYYLFSLL